MTLGTLVSQIIGFVGFLFIARLFGPEKYGVYATVLAFVMFFHLFTANGMQKVIVREGSKQIESVTQILNSLIGLKLLFVGAALILCIGVSFFTNYSPFIKLLIIIFSAEIIYFGLDSFLGAIYQTFEKMQYIAIFQVLVRILVTGLSILFLYLGVGVLVILLINLFSKFLVLLVNYFWSRRFHKFIFPFSIQVRPEIVKATAIFSLMGFISTFAVRIDVLMISFLSNSSDVGIYSVAHELGREGLILRNIIAVAFFPIAIKFFKSEKIRGKTLLTYSAAMFLIVFLGCILVFFFAEDIVLLIFGKDYIISGHILKYLAFYLPFSFSTLPFTICLQATHNENILLIVMSLAALTNIPLNLVFFYKFGLIGIAYSTIIVFFISAVSMSILGFRRMKKAGYLV